MAWFLVDVAKYCCISYSPSPKYSVLFPNLLPHPTLSQGLLTLLPTKIFFKVLWFTLMVSMWQGEYALHQSKLWSCQVSLVQAEGTCRNMLSPSKAFLHALHFARSRCANIL